MKKILLLICVYPLIQICNGQNIYYDAVRLQKLHLQIDSLENAGTEEAIRLKVEKRNEYYQVLLPYAGSCTASTLDSVRNCLIRSNPFLTSDMLPSSTGDATTILQKLSGAIAGGGIGGFDVTALADGLAKFLIKRGKEELNIAFFQRMKEFLDKNLEAKTLFPATSDFLGSIASYRYAELLQSLREAFYKDISNIIVNLNLLIDLPKYQELLKTLPEIRVAVRSAKIVSELSQSATSLHPAELIERLAGLQEWGEMNVNLASAWKMLNVLSESVRRVDFIMEERSETRKVLNDTFTLANIKISDQLTLIDTQFIPKGSSVITNFSVTKMVTSAEAGWITFSDFHDAVLSDTTTLKIFLGLLFQKVEGIVFKNAGSEIISVQDFMRNNQHNVLRIADLVENFLLLANDVEQSIHDIKQKGAQDIADNDYYTYINKAINIIEYGFKAANVVKPGIANDRYIVMARNANDLYKHIYTKNYNAAVMNAYLILEEILTKNEMAVAEKQQLYDTLRKTGEWARLSAGEKTIKLKDSVAFTAARLQLQQSKFTEADSLSNRQSTVEKILQYGNLIASVVKSESAEEAAAAIEAAVLPAGSSSIKKNAAWNISLNAYIGGYFGRSVNNTDKIDGNSSKIGVTAPVGIAFSKGLGYFKNGTSIGSLSLYGTLIDVGAIAGYRLNNDSSALESKITLNDIFTPGGYLVYGIGLPFKWLSYVPLSVGYGWQYGSKLYYKTGDGTLRISDKSRWRSNWFVGIDIPLANFLTTRYRKNN